MHISLNTIIFKILLQTVTMRREYGEDMENITLHIFSIRDEHIFVVYIAHVKSCIVTTASIFSIKIWQFSEQDSGLCLVHTTVDANM